MYDFSLKLLEFEIEIATLRIIVGVVDCLNRQLTHALHHVRDFVGRTLGCLNQRDGIPRVADRLIQAANLVGHPRRDGQTSRIVGGGVDPFARRQLCHRFGHRTFGAFQGCL